MLPAHPRQRQIPRRRPGCVREPQKSPDRRGDRVRHSAQLTGDLQPLIGKLAGQPLAAVPAGIDDMADRQPMAHLNPHSGCNGLPLVPAAGDKLHPAHRRVPSCPQRPCPAAAATCSRKAAGSSSL